MKKKYGSMGFLKKRKFCMHNKRVEGVTKNYSATGKFQQYIYSVLVAKNHQIRSRYLVHEFSVTDMFFDSVLYG